ncbi:hypothetical protein KFK09_013275 [Dendrobium nobile]|uniref:Uncharacterized protein n=1 Tax=Dendrobium nobile TaxID=94219 RepID=A0A8T3B8C6_DENNO|nr:hypothetical protein KFK09_013275 [Dendrobium nobile]
MEYFPCSYYKVMNSTCSDHCPILLQSYNTSRNSHKFLYKNYWAKNARYWDTLTIAFAQHSQGNPIVDLYHKLQRLKYLIKTKTWASSNSIASSLSDLQDQENTCLMKQDIDPPKCNIKCQSQKD